MKELSFLCLCIAAALIKADQSDPNDEAWQQYKVKFRCVSRINLNILLTFHSNINYQIEFGRTYGRSEEMQRKEYFIQTKRLIDEHNQQESMWTMAHNEFSDMVTLS